MNLGQADQFLLKPGSEIVTIRHSAFKFSIVNYSPCKGIDKKHFAWLQSSFQYNALWVNLNCTNFRRADNAVIIHYIVAAGPQAVSVQVGATVSTISEREEGR